VSGALAGRFRSVVAAEAISRNARVIERACRPVLRVVTGRAIIRALNVIRRFSHGHSAVVARCARAHRRLVFELRVRPFLGRMAVLTLIARLDVAGRLTSRDNRIVTACA
jgi:hypothetical protein